jgi:DNA modification methylase
MTPFYDQDWPALDPILSSASTGSGVSITGFPTEFPISFPASSVPEVTTPLSSLPAEAEPGKRVVLIHKEGPAFERPIGQGVDYIWQCDAFEFFKALPSNYASCIVTSPPYWGLRDYGVNGQIGLEPTLKEFIDSLVALFREARRVLRDDGTLWVNMGDGYANDGKWGGSTSGKHAKALHGKSGPGRQKRVTGFKPKDLIGQPWRLAIALQDDGWYLRNDIIWSKPNPMPESAKDRFTKSHEYVFLLTKSERYWFDLEAVKEPAVDGNNRGTFLGGTNRLRKANIQSGEHVPSDKGASRQLATHRNRRTVWTIAIEQAEIAHYATFPTKLIEPMILAGCPEKICCTCGKPWKRHVEVIGGATGKSWHDHASDLGAGQSQPKPEFSNSKVQRTYKRVDHGLKPACECNADTRAGIVIDPFMGSGTTALVARKHGRHYLGCDLNPEYIAGARKRLTQADPFETRRVSETINQPSLFEVSNA